MKEDDDAIEILVDAGVLTKAQAHRMRLAMRVADKVGHTRSLRLLSVGVAVLACFLAAAATAAPWEWGEVLFGTLAGTATLVAFFTAVSTVQ